MYKVMRAVHPNHSYLGMPEMGLDSEHEDARSVIKRLTDKALQASDYGRRMTVIAPDGEEWTASDFVWHHTN